MDSSSFKTSLGKKLIAVALCVTAFVFLSISVFADTPVQPLQVITYSDTTTNVRISGTAERLHYNIDSFQVVFMNPPNNYGTSCTPVLVSFRFYNASDLPAYVGQAEFELTATSGTGNVNTIIYGYDQISTDLFVAESSYSTAEVGRIGIGASNDFAYYTGFVIPPRTSLYFSCIIYVNASAYAQNNTGATEDVNQVTLSALNLYTNQLSFSEDYPYYGEPIDFSEVIEAISDLQDTVSTSSEMQNLINILTYTGTGYTPQTSAFSSSLINITGNTSLTFRSRRDVFPCYYVTEDIELDSANDVIVQAGSLCYPVCISTYWRNAYTKYDYSCRYYLDCQNIWPSNASVQFVSHESNYADYWYENGKRINLFFKNGDSSNGYMIAGKLGYSATWFNVYVPAGTTPDFGTYSFDAGTITRIDTNDSRAINIFDLLKSWYNSYKSVEGLDDIQGNADEITDKSESAHTQEQSYFTQNAQAIQQTGLSNYQFSNDQENGIGSVSHDFTLLWNALGGFNSIYIFSLTLGLALMVLRHAPNAIKSSRRNKEE